MKITKAQNPYGVKVGQTWDVRDARRYSAFQIKKLIVKNACAYAEVYRKSTDKTSAIRLDRFVKYEIQK